MLVPYPSASVVHRDRHGAGDPRRHAPAAALPRAGLEATAAGPDAFAQAAQAVAGPVPGQGLGVRRRVVDHLDVDRRRAAADQDVDRRPRGVAQRVGQALAHHPVGEALIAPRITRRLIADFARASRPAGDGVPPALEELTTREIEVLRLVAQGLSNAEIASELVLGENTIKTHVGRLLAKLELRDRVQAVVLAYETGLVTPDVPV
jgi:DNA-binding CsgD family transcriptional regulator